MNRHPLIWNRSSEERRDATCVVLSGVFESQHIRFPQNALEIYAKDNVFYVQKSIT